MKKLVFYLLVLIPLIGFSQKDPNIKFYLNGKEFDWDSVFISGKSIKSLKIIGEPPNVEAQFESKEKVWKYNTLEGLLKTLHNYDKIKDEYITPVFIIQGKVITNPDNVKIDEVFFAKATLKSLSNVEGISGDCEKIVLIVIELSNTEIIKIRGSAFPQLDSLRK